MPSDKVSIRPIANKDISAVTEIQSQAVMETTATFALIPMNQTEMSQKLERLLEKRYPCLVAEVDKVVAGYAYVSPYNPRPGYRWTVENSIYLAPEFQHRGIGHKLLSELIRQAEKRGFRQMIAVIGDEQNHASIALHKKCGFEHSGKLKSVGFKHDRWLDIFIMQLALGQSDKTDPTE